VVVVESSLLVVPAHHGDIESTRLGDMRGCETLHFLHSLCTIEQRPTDPMHLCRNITTYTVKCKYIPYLGRTVYNFNRLVTLGKLIVPFALTQ